MTYRTLAALSAAALLQACSAPPPQPLPARPLVKFDAVLQPGCLIQTSHDLPATRGTAVMQLRIDTSGQVTSARVTQSSGSTAMDALLLNSARRCSFTPAFTLGGPDRARAEVEDDYMLSIAWPAPPLLGPHRCFRPDYTHAARRRGEEGSVVVQFRLRSEDGTVETRVQPGGAAAPMLRELSVRAVEACLRHAEARSTLQPGAWYAIPYTWCLE